MKLLYITDVFPPHCGGSGWSVYFFARGLRELGHQVDIISLDGSPREYDGFEVRTFPLKRSHAPFFASWDREKRQLPLLAQKIKAAAGSYDLIHAHHKVSALGTAIAQPERWFATIRDYWPICICGRSLYRTGAVCSRSDFTRCSSHDHFLKGMAAPFIYSWFEAKIQQRIKRLQTARNLLCISHYVREQLVPFFPPEKLEVLPNFAHELVTHSGEELPGRFIIFGGRLEENKGAHMLPEIMQLSRTDLPLVIVGEGSLQERLTIEFQQRNVSAIFLGYRELPAMLAILARSEFVLFPSVWAEPLGRVLIESAMLGKAVIAFSHPGGHRDIVEHERTGILAETPEDFAAAVGKLASDADLRQSLGREARRKYEHNFSPAAILPRLLSIYQA